jgi:hypothetical protein
MRTAFFLLALFATSNAVAQVSDEIDRFTGKRNISYTSSAEPKLGVPVISILAQQGGINAVRFMIAPTPGRYAIQSLQYIGCKQVDWLIDGEPLALGMVVHSSSRYGSMLLETITQEASAAQLAAIGSARQAEFRICQTEGVLSSEDVAAAKTIAGKLSGETEPAELPGPYRLKK